MQCCKAIFLSTAVLIMLICQNHAWGKRLIQPLKQIAEGYKIGSSIFNAVNEVKNYYYFTGDNHNVAKEGGDFAALCESCKKNCPHIESTPETGEQKKSDDGASPNLTCPIEVPNGVFLGSSTGGSCKGNADELCSFRYHDSYRGKGRVEGDLLITCTSSGKWGLPYYTQPYKQAPRVQSCPLALENGHFASACSGAVGEKCTAHIRGDYQGPEAGMDVLMECSPDLKWKLADRCPLNLAKGILTSPTGGPCTGFAGEKCTFRRREAGEVNESTDNEYLFTCLPSLEWALGGNQRCSRDCRSCSLASCAQNEMCAIDNSRCVFKNKEHEQRCVVDGLTNGVLSPITPGGSCSGAVGQTCSFRFHDSYTGPGARAGAFPVTCRPDLKWEPEEDRAQA